MRISWSSGQTGQPGHTGHTGQTSQIGQTGQTDLTFKLDFSGQISNPCDVSLLLP